jgi:hypothetical protein
MGDAHKKFVDSMSPEERMLINLRDELYGGSWDQMEEDLRDRLKGRPYIFKLVNRIQDDLSRIERLRDYETQNKVNLADYLTEEGEG